MDTEAVSRELTLSPDECYRAVCSRDRRFDGWFFFAVSTTGIYCRPSCPSPVHPKPAHATYYLTAAAAQRAGFRACKRCRPDATPGSPAWDMRADLVGRAMRLIADGVVDRDGVEGLAKQLAVSARHLDRLLLGAVGAGPLAIARAQRARTARVLIETTDMSFTEAAFASGFSSVRQFNDTVRSVFDSTPTALRAAANHGAAAPHGQLSLRLAYRSPYDAASLLAWFAARTVAGVQQVAEGCLTRTMSLRGGPGVARLRFVDDHVRCDLELEDVRDLAAAVERCRRLLDLDADPDAIAEHLGAHGGIGPAVAERRGLRAPGSVDGFETAVVALAGQQVSVASATSTLTRLVDRFGDTLAAGTAGEGGHPLRVFPSASVLADADLDGLGFTRRTRDAVRAVAVAVTDGLEIGPGSDRAEVKRRLLEIGGIGPWTADYVCLRALRDPDVLLVGDLIVRRGAAVLGLPAAAEELASAGEAWAPWRTYVTHHCWAAATAAVSPPPRPVSTEETHDS